MERPPKPHLFVAGAQKCLEFTDLVDIASLHYLSILGQMRPVFPFYSAVTANAERHFSALNVQSVLG